MAEVYFMDMLDNVLAEIPDCPTPVAEAAMRRAVVDWFRETLTWQEDLNAITMVDGLLRYPLTEPAGSQIVQMHGLLKDNGDDIAGDYVWHLKKPDTLVFRDNTPPAGLRVTPRAYLAPTHTANSIDTAQFVWLFEWELGATAILRDQLSRPWYNPQEAAKKRAQFRAEIARARNMENVGNRTGDLRARPQSFM